MSSEPRGIIHKLLAADAALAALEEISDETLLEAVCREKQESIDALLGNPEDLAVERALSEGQSGRLVAISQDEHTVLALQAEMVNDRLLAALSSGGIGEVRLVLSSSRMRLLGYDSSTAGVLPLGTPAAAAIHEVIPSVLHLSDGPYRRPDVVEQAALELVTLGYFAPAVVVFSIEDLAIVQLAGLAHVSADAVHRYRVRVSPSVRIVSRAPVPLDQVGEAEFVVFRSRSSMRDHVAVIVGNPDPAAPVYLRMHSACLTGDLLASLQDGGSDALHGTVKSMAELGGGVLLYLDHEGRSNNISNKIRDYRLLQHSDNAFDADEILGFDLDQRRFDFAATMVRQLGYTHVRLLTNNPAKAFSFQEAGLDVVSTHRLGARLAFAYPRHRLAKELSVEKLLEAEADIPTRRH